MIRLTIAAALIVAPPALADVAAISGCEVSKRETVQPVIHCDIKNHSQRAIASVTFRAIVKSPEREVPWDEIGDGWHKHHASIPGGIEPGEAANVFMAVARLDTRSDGLPLEVMFLEAQFIDVNGERIGEVVGVEEPHPMDTISNALEGALNP